MNLIGWNTGFLDGFASSSRERLHMIFVGLCGVFGILTFAMQRIFSVGGCQQSAFAVHDGNANAQCPKIYSGNGSHARSPVMSFAPVRLSSRESSHLAFRRELDAIDQTQDEQ